MLAPKTDSVAFFKVKNDGYDLGDQRRHIDKDDLPAVTDEINEYLSLLRAGESMDNYQPILGHIVAKGEIASDGEYNLSGERYRVEETKTSTYDMVPFREVCTLEYGASLPKRDRAAGPYPVMGSNGISDYHSEYLIKGPAIIVGRKGSAGEVSYVESNCFPIDTTYYVSIVNHDRTDLRYLYHLLKTLDLPGLREGAGIPGLNRNDVYQKYKLPLPPLEVQHKLVAEIEGYQRVLDGARAVVENWRPRIAVDPEWPVVALGELCSLGGNITKDVDLALPYFGADSIESGSGKLIKVESAESQGVSGPVYEFDGERLLYSKIRPYLNKLAVVDLKGYCSSDMYPLVPDQSKIAITYLATYMLSEEFNGGIRHYYERANIPKINRSQLFQVAIPVPALDIQHAIVAEIEAEQALVSANAELVERMEQRIQDTIARVWEG